MTPEVEYVEVARAETERGELVLRERRPEDGGPTSLELRANGVFVMDTVEVSTERAMAQAALALVDDATRGRRRRAGARLHDARGARRLPGREVRGRRDRAGPGRLDARRPRPHGPALLADERVTVVEADIVVGAGRGAAGVVRPGAAGRRQRTRLPGARRQRGALRARRRSTDARRLLRPGGALVVWSAGRGGRAGRRRCGRCSATSRPSRHDVQLQDRDEQYWLYVARG